MSSTDVKHPESSGNSKTTLEKGGRDPADVTLDYILNDFCSYFNDCVHLCKAKQLAEKKYDIEQEADGCWSVDDIKRAWGKTQRMKKESRRNDFALVIMLQVIEIQRKERPGLVEGGNIVQICAEQGNNDQMKGQRENERIEDGLQSAVDMNQACGKAESMKGNSEDRSSQSNTEAPEGIKQSSIYIRIPLLKMVDNETILSNSQLSPVPSSYKLIDGSPSDTDLRKGKSYVMSFDNRTNNAKWVYEILNRETLANNCQEGFEPPYSRGHLAAAANHRWCREALNDANLNSNITPQHYSLNSGVWNMLENRCRLMSIDTNNIRNVHVYSGPLYRNRPGLRKVLRGKRVPSHFFKVIIVENENGTVEEPECYILPNRAIILDLDGFDCYQETIEEIEHCSRLTFIERRPNVREDRIITARLQGEGLNGRTYANIKASICR